MSASWSAVSLSKYEPTTTPRRANDGGTHRGLPRAAQGRRVAALGFMVLASALVRLHAAEVPVRFVEGSIHGFLVLRTVEGVQIGQGDLTQVVRGGAIEGRMVLHFDDGSLLEESVAFTQQRVFRMQTYRQIQRGPAFPEDTEISLERSTGRWHVKTHNREDGRDTVIDGTIDLPADVYNGMVLTVAKNIVDGAGETVHFVAFTPKPRIIQLEMRQTNAQKVLVGRLEKTAVHIVFRPRLGKWLDLFASLLGRTPPDQHAWIVTDGVPAFVRFEGPLYLAGPVWRIQLTSPRWPE